MAIVTKYGDGYPAPGGQSVQSIDAEAQVRCIYSKISVANLDSATSKLYLGRIPSNARILPNSTLYNSAITGLTTLDVGFSGAVAALLAAGDVSSAGTKSLVAAVAAGNLGRRAWQHAGLTADPGGLLDVFATMNAGATAAGTLEAFLYFAKG
jgi:hypothetical protein